MSLETERFHKMLALAIDPAAYDGEVVAALRKAYELVRKEPGLANLRHVPAPPSASSIQTRIMNLPPFWLNIALGSLSEQAYDLGLKSKITCDFDEIPTAIDIRCDGATQPCIAFKSHIHWLIEYINAQPPMPQHHPNQ